MLSVVLATGALVMMGAGACADEPQRPSGPAEGSQEMEALYETFAWVLDRRVAYGRPVAIIPYERLSVRARTRLPLDAPELLRALRSRIRDDYEEIYTSAWLTSSSNMSDPPPSPDASIYWLEEMKETEEGVYEISVGHMLAHQFFDEDFWMICSSELRFVVERNNQEWRVQLIGRATS